MKQEDLFRTLFESSPDAIFIEDDDGYVLDCNPAAAALHRTTLEHVVGKHVSELVPPGRRDRILTAANILDEFEGLSLTADGLSVPVWIRTSRIEYKGQPALLLHVRDIADRKRLEENLRASNDELELRVQSRTTELARANQVLRAEIAERNRSEEDRRKLEEQFRSAQRMEAVGRLAGGVAHDFNNLLTVVLGRCEIMMERLSPGHFMLPDVTLIHDTAQKAASVTRQLLAFGRKQVLKPKVLDINAVISNMKAMLASLISENIRFTVTQGVDVWSVEADRGQIEQVILNLVVNSIDAMPRGGELTIETGSVEWSEDNANLGFPMRAGRYATFAVTDTGRGMNSETLSHAFEPFFTTKDESKGTGLGLSTVYGIVKQSGGYVSAISEPQRGTTFRIFLPGVNRAPEPVAPRPNAAPSGNETVLVVEDALVVRKLARELLEYRGYKVLEAASGEEALNVFEAENAIDLLLSDIIMPKMNGRELAEKAAKLRPSMKILLMSGYADEITRNQLVREGFEFIAKPFTSNALAVKVREVLDR